MLNKISLFESKCVAGGKMSDKFSLPMEEFYSVFIKTVCDYVACEVDFTIIKK